MSRPRSPRRVLFVSYLFPPVGGVGVHRVTKFVKYLPQFGWDCSVLTVSNPSTPLLDDSLQRDIPAATKICRAKTWEPGYQLKAAVGNGQSVPPGVTGRMTNRVKGCLRSIGNLILQPDAQILWRPDALRQGRRLLAETPHDAIIATGPPFSSLLVGASLAKSCGLPLILDYRDEWGISNAYWENKQHNAFSNWVQNRMQNAALRAATTVIATTPASTQSLQESAHKAGSAARSFCLLNGFDPEDFPAEDDRPRKDFGNGLALCRLSFVGTLWNLNPIEPFAAGVQRFAALHPQLAPHLEIVLAGRRTPEQDAALEQLATTGCRIVTQPFMAHDEAVQLMRSSDSLLLINADKPHTHRIINAKTFEYMAARKPMFVVAPRGDLWDVVQDLPGTKLCPPGDPDQIARALAEVVKRHLQGLRFAPDEWKIEHYERRQLASELAGHLNQTVRQFQSRRKTSSRSTESMSPLSASTSEALEEIGAAS